MARQIQEKFGLLVNLKEGYEKSVYRAEQVIQEYRADRLGDGTNVEDIEGVPLWFVDGCIADVGNSVAMPREQLMHSYPFDIITETCIFPDGFFSASVKPINGLTGLMVYSQRIDPARYLNQPRKFKFADEYAMSRLTHILSKTKVGISMKAFNGLDKFPIREFPLDSYTDDTGFVALIRQANDQGASEIMLALLHIRAILEPYPFIASYLKNYRKKKALIPTYPAHALMELENAIDMSYMI